MPAPGALLCGLLIGLLPAFAQTAAPLADKARQDFDRVDQAPRPSLNDALSCMQSHAALLFAANADVHYLIHYRKGYCEMFAAFATTSGGGNFGAAVRDFSQALNVWPSKLRIAPPAGLRILVVLARLEQGRTADSYPELGQSLEAAIGDEACPATPVMQPAFCKSLVETGKTWLAWLAWHKRGLEEARKRAAGLSARTWTTWLDGWEATAANRPSEALPKLEQALAEWSAAENATSPEVVTLFGPRIEAGPMYATLGAAQYAARRYDAAIASFDRSLKAEENNSGLIYLRARAKDALGLGPAAAEDYLRAQQTAQATGDTTWPAGDASFYRGRIAYGARDYAGAEQDFARAAAAPLHEVGKGEVGAWRALAAAMRGDCSGAQGMEPALAAPPAGFPRPEAAAVLFRCLSAGATTVEAMAALAREYANRAPASELEKLRLRLADAYADQGVAFDDKKDTRSAAQAYRQAIEWNPRHTKARYNLGAIYLEDKNYPSAEAEYRTLVQADAKDYEAQFWLAVSILGQKPGDARRAEACTLLKSSLTIADPEKRAEFTRTFTSARCP